jgi:serine O-acetyltransferase
MQIAAQIFPVGKAVDPVFAQIRAEAEAAVRREPDLGSFLTASILNHASIEQAVAHRIGARLSHQDFPGGLIEQNFLELAGREPALGEAIRADLLAVADRDPACRRLMEPLLYFKGFQALQTHRLAHALWNAGRMDFALYLQSRASAVFQTDINPEARIGKGLFLDHATGLVVGATAVIDDDVSILHGVTLGGTGHHRGDRHPKIRKGVLIGAGAKIIGNIEIGACSRIAAGSVVLKAVPPGVTVAGVPARVVGGSGCAEPAREMDQVPIGKPREQ